MDRDIFIKIYDKMIQESKEPVELVLEVNQKKPTIYNQILTPEDKIRQNPALPFRFQTDVEGMHNFICIFQDIVEKHQIAMQNLGPTLWAVYIATLSYFGNKRLAERDSAYNNIERDSDGMIINKIGILSAFQGKGSAKCSEKSAAVHNLLTVLYGNGNLGNYEPSIALSKVNDELHAFNILRDEKQKKTLFFDTSYLVTDKDGMLYCGIYLVSDEDYNKFIHGKKIEPELITPGTEGVDNGKRQYGIENDEISNEI